MTTRTMEQVRQEGITALTTELGPVDTVRFLQQFDSGSGDYTAERDRLLGNPSIDELTEKIRRLRKMR